VIPDAAIHAVTHNALSVLGPVVGAFGILIAVIAHRRAARAVSECSALINGSVGSRGTVDPRALRDLAVVRYDALSEMSGQFSFSVALLNALGDGVVLSSINGRSETRTYAKIVVSGQGTQALSPEEEQAVRAARLGQGLPAAALAPGTLPPGTLAPGTLAPGTLAPGTTVTVRTRSSRPAA
jgi:hypothetical protein